MRAKYNEDQVSWRGIDLRQKTNKQTNKQKNSPKMEE